MITTNEVVAQGLATEAVLGVWQHSCLLKASGPHPPIPKVFCLFSCFVPELGARQMYIIRANWCFGRLLDSYN